MTLQVVAGASHSATACASMAEGFCGLPILILIRRRVTAFWGCAAWGPLLVQQ